MPNEIPIHGPSSSGMPWQVGAALEVGGGMNPMDGDNPSVPGMPTFPAVDASAPSRGSKGGSDPTPAMPGA